LNFDIGEIVFVADDPRVFGKIAEIQEATSQIEFFYSVADRRTESISLDRLSRFELLRQTRVFFEEYPGHWRVGRIRSGLFHDDSPIIYEIRFPNRESREISETDVFVRCLDTFSDPADILANGCAETQFFADRRRNALSHLRKMKSACEGLTGPFSSAIDLVPHQIAISRRVLQDPYMRYLLADEVGLGKTIEAGCIVRQILIDRPNKVVIVLVPEVLVEQWEHELHVKFDINLEDGSVSVMSFNEASSLDGAPDVLVIDEAHQVVAVKQIDQNIDLAHIEKLAHHSESLLLLSATPALGDEDRLFGLLHLLDPASYPTSDRMGFATKVASRQSIGRLLLPMQPGGTPFVLRRQATTACSMFPKDGVVQELGAIIAEIDEDPSAMDQRIVMLRDHIAKTYRIHDRLLRSRRTDAEAWAMTPRAKPYPNVNHIRYVFDNGPSIGNLFGLLEGWRLAAHSNETNDRKELVRRWRSLISATLCGPSALMEILNTFNELFPGEREHLDAFINLAGIEDLKNHRYLAVLEDLKEWRASQPNPISGRPKAKIVCFASDLADANYLCEYLKKKLGPFDVVSIAGQIDPGTRITQLSSFEKDHQSWVLIADTSAEEGLNLQFIHAIFHMNLPDSVGRLEQRIGRLDRFGRKISNLQHRILIPNDDEDAPWYVWTDILLNGFRIFNSSVSDIQFKIEEMEEIIWDRFFEEGSSCVDSLSELVSETILEERQKLNEQHTLDEIASLSEGAEDLVNRMEDVEFDEEILMKDIQNWVGEVLQINQYPPKPNADEYLRFFWDKNTLVPSVPWQRLFESSLDTPLTWSREQAQKMKNHPRLLRPGSRFVDALGQIAAWDDRGIAYSTWRVVPSANEVSMAFRLIWILTPKISSATPVWELHERPDLVRRSETYLPILSFDQFVDIEGNIIEDPQTLEILSSPYLDGDAKQGRSDINLGSRPELLDRMVDAHTFRELVRNVVPKCKSHIQCSPEFVDATSNARQRFEREATSMERSIRQRQIFLESEYGQKLQGWEESIADLEIIGDAITEPELRLDEIGFMIISSEHP
jgi:ATP-dependent helicase HepA